MGGVRMLVLIQPTTLNSSPPIKPNLISTTALHALPMLILLIWTRNSATTLNWDKKISYSTLLCPKLFKFVLFYVAFFFYLAPFYWAVFFFFTKCFVNVNTSIFGVLWLIFISVIITNAITQCEWTLRSEKLWEMVKLDKFRHTDNSALWIIRTVCLYSDRDELSEVDCSAQLRQSRQQVSPKRADSFVFTY